MLEYTHIYVTLSTIMFEHLSMHIWDQIFNKKKQINIWHQYNFGLKCDKFGTPFFIKYL